MKHIRFLLLLLVLLLCLFPLSSCMAQITAAAPGANPPEAAGWRTLSAESERVIAKDQKILYGILYPEDSPKEIKESVTALYEALKKRSNGGLAAIEQDTPGVTKYQPEAFQILVGSTGAPETAQVLSSLGYGDWTVRFCGNKLVVAGFSRYALDNAITELIQQVKKYAGSDGTIVFPGDLNITKTTDEVINHLPGYDTESRIPLVTAPEGDDSSLAIVGGTTVTEYDWYLSKLEALGYQYHTSNTIANNYFATYYNDQYVIHAGFYAYESSARITIEKKTALVGLESENQYSPAAGVTASLALLGLYGPESGEAENGLSSVIRLADGSFLIIDGGFYASESRLYAYLRTLVPEGKITIAAWILTHNHGDHSQCISTFLPKHQDEVILEQLIFHFPHSYAYIEAETNENSGPVTAASAMPGCRIIKAHTGQKFFIRNAVVEILYTMDSYLPNTLAIFNNSSLAFTVETEGERILYLGDASDEAAKILVNMYGEYMKSDILQMAHHGLRNGHGLSMPGTVKLYQLVRAEVCLWPVGWGEYLNAANKAPEYQMNKFTWNYAATNGAREVFIAGAANEVTVLQLPYLAFTAVKTTA